jgi:hypothetical protein
MHADSASSRWSHLASVPASSTFQTVIAEPVRDVAVLAEPAIALAAQAVWLRRV